MTLAPALPAPTVPRGRRRTTARTRPAGDRVLVPGCGGACAAEPGGLRADAATRRRRLCRLAGALVAAATRIAVWTPAGVRTQRRVAVCSAAGVLVALGIRVEVVNPATPWPRTGRGHLVVSNSISWLDHLALLVALRATPVADAALRNRPLVGGLARRLGTVFVSSGQPRSVATGVAEAAALLRRGESVSVHPEDGTTCGAGTGPFRAAFFQAAVDAGAAVCPVAVRYRLDGAPGTIPAACTGAPPARTVGRIVAARHLVVEVHLLPALDAAGGDRRALARLARSRVAAVLDT